MRLNRIFLYILAVSLCATSMMAETHYKPHISIGGHAGAALSKMSFSPSVPQAWNTGVLVGVTARYQEEKLFGIIGELNFIQRGWSETFENDASLSYRRTLTYVTLPILTHISFGSKRFKGFVNLGPEIGVMIGDNISSNFDYRKPDVVGVPSSRMTEQMVTDISGHFDYGIAVGLGAEYYIKPRHSITFECCFYYGLGNIFPSAKADTFSASRSMTLSASIGYNFRLK